MDYVPWRRPGWPSRPKSGAPNSAGVAAGYPSLHGQSAVFHLRGAIHSTSPWTTPMGVRSTRSPWLERSMPTSCQQRIHPFRFSSNLPFAVRHSRFLKDQHVGGCAGGRAGFHPRCGSLAPPWRAGSADRTGWTGLHCRECPLWEVPRLLDSIGCACLACASRAGPNGDPPVRVSLFTNASTNTVSSRGPGQR